MQNKQRHPLIEDILAVITASLFVSLGLYFLKYCSFLAGGTAGLALILNQVTDFSFGQVFFAINLPFYYLAWTRMGKRFTLNTFAAVAVVSLVTDYFHLLIHIDALNRYFAAVTGGFLIGMGMLILFRHGSSLGGLGIMAKFLQDGYGISAGKFQMSVDFAIVTIGYFLVPFDVLLLSILSVFSLNLVITLNHKPGRYQIT